MARQKCYYEVLDIQREATAEEIRKAYKTRALQLHPDKNRHRLEEATLEFSLLQQAYTVLIDPHERRWYDNHREAILKGKPTNTVDEDTMFDLMPYFSTSAFKGFDDGPKGFFAVYRKIFEDIEAEEHGLEEYNEYISKDETCFTSFGYSDTLFLPTLKAFYQKWTHFQTKRTFSSMDKYKPSDAENREHRRYLEKENKKLRDSMKKEYNETVRSLALFCRKRDPRYAIYQKNLEHKSKPVKKESKNLHNSQIFEEQSWAKVDEGEYLKYFELHPELAEEPDTLTEDISLIEYYCDLCSKTFKSKQQWENHEKSKKHIKQAQLYGDIDQISESSIEQISEYSSYSDIDNYETDEEFKDAYTHSPVESPIDTIVELEQQVEQLDIKDENTTVKKKRRADKNKRDAKPIDFVCDTCRKSFDSRNSLFKHLKSSKHAASQ